jgi:hypothetical protein
VHFIETGLVLPIFKKIDPFREFGKILFQKQNSKEAAKIYFFLKKLTKSKENNVQ